MSGPSEQSESPENEEAGRKRHKASPHVQSHLHPSPTADIKLSLSEICLPAPDVEQLTAELLAQFPPKDWRRAPANNLSLLDLTNLLGWHSAKAPLKLPDKQPGQICSMPTEGIELARISELNLSTIPHTFHLTIAAELFDRHPLYLIRNLSGFEEVDHAKIAELFLHRMPNGVTICGPLLLEHLPLFKGLDHGLLFNRLLEASREDARVAIANFDRFDGVDPSSAALRALVTSGCADCLADNIEKFQGVDRTSLASKMQEARVSAFAALARNAAKFPCLNHNELVRRFLKNTFLPSEIATFVKHAGNLINLDYRAFADVLANKYPDALADNIDSFPGVDRHIVARKLMSKKIGAFSALARNAGKFPGLDQKELVRRFLTSAPSEDQLGDFLLQILPCNQIEPEWLIKTTIRYDFEMLPSLYQAFAEFSERFEFNRHRFLSVLIAETERYLTSCAQDGAETSSDIVADDLSYLREHAVPFIQTLIQDAPAEQRQELVRQLLASDDFYISALADCLICFEGSARWDLIERLIKAGQESQFELLQHFNFLASEERATIIQLIMAADPLDGPDLIGYFVPDLDVSEQTRIIQALAQAGRFDVIDELTRQIPLYDMDVLRQLVKTYPKSDLALSIGSHAIKCGSNEELDRASRDALSKRRAQFKAAREDKTERLSSSRSSSLMADLLERKAFALLLGTDLPLELPARNRAEWVDELRNNSHAAPELAAYLRETIPRNSDLSLFGPLAASGYPDEVLSVLSRYSNVPQSKLSEIYCSVATGYIVTGYFENADRIISEMHITEDALARFLNECMKEHYQANNLRSLFAIAAWIRSQPQNLIARRAIANSEIYEPFISPFIDNQQSSMVYNSPNELFIRLGFPLLQEKGLLEPCSVEVLTEMIALFLQRKASTAAAWESHRANCAQWELDPKFPITQDMIRDELNSILSFYLDYPRLKAPGLRYAVRLLTDSGLPLKGLNGNDIQRRIEIFDWEYPIPGINMYPGKPCIARAFGALTNPSLDSDISRSDRAFLTGDLDPKSVNTYCSALLLRVLTSQDVATLGFFDQELLTGLIGLPDEYEGTARHILHNLDAARGNIQPLAPSLVGRAFDFSVERLGRDAARSFQFSEASRTLYQATRDILLNLRQPRSTENLAVSKARITFALKETDKGILSKASLLPEKQAEKIRYRSDLINAVIKSVEEATCEAELLHVLCKHAKVDKQVKKHVRELALLRARDRIALKGHEVDTLKSHEPCKESVERMYEILRDRVLHDASLVPSLGEHVSALGEALGIASFEEDLKRLGTIGTRGVESIRAYATRGLLGELAGFISESCLTRQENLMRRHPNAMAIVFVKNADKPESMRLEGSCMLLTVRDNDGHDVLVIRGLNPTQNLILSLSAASFFENFLEHVVRPIARELKIQKIAIPTPQEGIFFEARTNRPSLAVYLTERCKNLPNISFENDRDRAVFNDNSFEQSCVLL